MEEILSSIKKIIAEDSGKPPILSKRSVSLDRRTAAPRVEEATPEADENESASESLGGEEDVLELTESAPEPLPEPVTKAAVKAEIVSSTTAVASRSALESLSKMIVKPEASHADTLEGLVREMLRPMLKDWLDAKLPDIVERVVAQEVARISGRLS
jgi:cell pole-organizing protein PopZ